MARVFTHAFRQINIQPKEDIKKFQPKPPAERMKRAAAGVGRSQSPATDCSSLPMDEEEADHSVLSRTLKRKFMELEDITQRLRARLFDVTGDADTDPDDQFESDLNTVPTEDDEFEDLQQRGLISDNFDWIQMCRNQQPNLAAEQDAEHKYLYGNDSDATDAAEESSPPDDSADNVNVLTEKLLSSVLIDNDEQTSAAKLHPIMEPSN